MANLNMSESKDELFQLNESYLNHFIQYYNKEELNAFSTIVKYRDESERRINEIQEEIDYEINRIEKEFSNYRESDNSFNIVHEIKPRLLKLKENPNQKIFRIFQDTVEEYGGDLNNRINRNIIDCVQSLLEGLLFLSITLKKVRIIKGTASRFINNIIDLGFPLRLEKKMMLYILRDIDISPPDPKPRKSEIYEWYSIHLSNLGNDLNKAYDAIIAEILTKGLKVEDYIKTDTPQYLNRSYRIWLSKKMKRK